MSMQTIFLTLLLTIGLGMVAYGLLPVISARASAAWPCVRGEIMHSEVEQGDEAYSPQVRYSYAVGGQAYSGKRIAFGLPGMSSGHGFAQAYVQRYPVGSSVAVYYDPSRPSTSVLEPGLSRRSFIPMAIGLGFAFFGGWFALMGWLMHPSPGGPTTHPGKRLPALRSPP